MYFIFLSTRGAAAPLRFNQIVQITLLKCFPLHLHTYNSSLCVFATKKKTDISRYRSDTREFESRQIDTASFPRNENFSSRRKIISTWNRGKQISILSRDAFASRPLSISKKREEQGGLFEERKKEVGCASASFSFFLCRGQSKRVITGENRVARCTRSRIILFTFIDCHG